MAFTVKWGSLISSIRYRIRNEGRAMAVRTTAGRIVQIISISCESRISLSVSVVVTMVIIIYNTRTLIKITTIKAWSWNLSSSSIRGDAAS